jgi:hypothetical protein
MTESRRKYRPPEPGPLHLRESVSRPLLALAGDIAADARLDVILVEEVERALRCELPDEVLACFATGDDTLPEWGFRLGEVADHTARARELGCPSDLIAVGRHPDSHVLYCVSRRGDRRRAVGLTEFEVGANGDTNWRDLGAWLAERAGLEPDVCSRPSSKSVQLSLFSDFEPLAPASRAWLLVG